MRRILSFRMQTCVTHAGSAMGRFGGTYCLHLEGSRVRQARCMLPWLLFEPKHGGWMFPPRRLSTFTGLHGVIPHKNSHLVSLTSHGRDYGDLLRCNSMQSGKYLPTFRRNMLPQPWMDAISSKMSGSTRQYSVISHERELPGTSFAMRVSGVSILYSVQH
jgi:hypothetical protein